MKPWQAGVGVIVFVALVATFLGLSHLLDLTEPWVAFLWLLCWAGIDSHLPARFLPTLTGAAAGLALGWLLRWAPLQWGAAGTAISMAVVLLTLGWTFLRGSHGPVVNHPLWIFFTVVTVPWVLQPVAFSQLYASLALGAAFFGGVLLTGSWLAARRANQGVTTQTRPS
jgi:hypothetical protein